MTTRPNRLYIAGHPSPGGRLFFCKVVEKNPLSPKKPIKYKQYLRTVKIFRCKTTYGITGTK